MKKIILFIAMTILVSTAWGQSQQLQTIKGTTKDKKRIEVQYYKGATQDYIESVKYQLVDELNAENKNKQNSINDLQHQLNKANKTIDNLNKQLKNSDNSDPCEEIVKQLNEKQDEIDQLNEQMGHLNTQLNEMQAENDRLRAQLDSIKAVNRQLSQKQSRPSRSPIIGVEATVGSVLLSKKGFNDPWEKALSWNKQVAIYYGSGRLSESVPLSVEAGVGFRSLPMAASFASDYPISATDIDHCDYEAIYKDLTEKLTMNCVEIPVRLCIGQPTKDKVSVYAKLGVSPSFTLSAKLANGTYTKQGEYPNWNVTFDDIHELGFFTNGKEDSKTVTPDKRFNLWGNAAFGAYVPLDSSLLFNVGAKLDYSIMKIGTFTTTTDDKDNPLYIGGLLKYDGRLFIPNLQAGFVYTLR
jgi:hypothetical protein